jgi:hypothetical protein
MERIKKCVCGEDMILTSDGHLICSRYFENLKRGIQRQSEIIDVILN